MKEKRISPEKTSEKSTQTKYATSDVKAVNIQTRARSSIWREMCFEACKHVNDKINHQL